MDKRQLHHIRTKLHWLKPWYFLVLVAISGSICIVALRDNNEHMIKLRDALYAADKSDGDVQGALNRLQNYVTAHMNTNLNAGPNPVYPPIQLKYTYDRLVQAESTRYAQSNTALYTQAQAYCEAQNHSDFSGRNRVPCITEYVQSHTTTGQLPTIPDALYKFAFISPKWSPDLAGWSLATTVVFGLLFIVSFAASRWLRR